MLEKIRKKIRKLFENLNIKSQKNKIVPYQNLTKKNIAYNENLSETKESLSNPSSPNIITTLQQKKPAATVYKLRTKIYPINIEKCVEQYDFTATQAILELIIRTFFFLDKIHASSLEDQDAYEHAQKIIQCIRQIHHQLSKLPQPENSQDYPQYIKKINAYIQIIEEQINQFNPQDKQQPFLPSIKGEKSRLLAKFYMEYLIVLSKTFLFNQPKINIEQNLSHELIIPIQINRQNASERLEILEKNIKNTLSTSKQPTFIEIIENLDRRERREQHRPQENTENKKSITHLGELLNNTESEKQAAIKKALTTLKIQIQELYEAITAFPEDYPPVLNDHEKKALIEDLLFERNPFDYLLITKYFKQDHAQTFHDIFKNLSSKTLQTTQIKSSFPFPLDDDDFSDITSVASESVEKAQSPFTLNFNFPLLRKTPKIHPHQVKENSNISQKLSIF